jgi:hypothetical protein
VQHGETHQSIALEREVETFQGGESMEKKWSYEGFDVEEGFKPGSKHFHYFFLVSEKGKKKCLAGWRGRATVIDSKDSGKPQKAALNGAYDRYFDLEMGLIETGPSR